MHIDYIAIDYCLTFHYIIDISCTLFHIYYAMDIAMLCFSRHDILLYCCYIMPPLLLFSLLACAIFVIRLLFSPLPLPLLLPALFRLITLIVIYAMRLRCHCAIDAPLLLLGLLPHYCCALHGLLFSPFAITLACLLIFHIYIYCWAFSLLVHHYILYYAIIHYYTCSYYFILLCHYYCYWYVIIITLPLLLLSLRYYYIWLLLLYTCH